MIRIRVLGACTIFLLSACSLHAEEVTSFESCVAAGGPMIKTFPARCVAPDGTHWIDEKAAAKQAAKAKLCVDMCGNGSCEEIVCMAEGCPCSETSESCPQDCKK